MRNEPVSPAPSLSERTLRPSRLKILGALAPSLFLAAGGAWLISLGVWTGWFIAAVGGLGVLASLLMLLPNTAYLHLDAEGVRIRQGWRTARYRWADIDRFGVTVVDGTMTVALSFSPEYARPTHGPKAVASPLGWEGTLPDNYGLPPLALAHLLNEYKKASWLRGDPGSSEGQRG